MEHQTKLAEAERIHKYSEFHGKGIVLNDTLLKALETEPYLYITFAGKPAVTGITVYEG